MGYIGSRPSNIWFEPSKKENIRVFKWGKYERWNYELVGKSLRFVGAKIGPLCCGSKMDPIFSKHF
jgi:hypothetical protein